MKDKFTEEDIRQAFFDIAEEMEKECGDWQNQPETELDRALKERIINAAKTMLS